MIWCSVPVLVFSLFIPFLHLAAYGTVSIEHREHGTYFRVVGQKRYERNELCVGKGLVVVRHSIDPITPKEDTTQQLGTMR